MNKNQFSDRECLAALMIFSAMLLSALDDMNRKRLQDNLDQYISLMKTVDIGTFLGEIEQDRLRHLLQIFLEMSKSYSYLSQIQSK